MNRAIPALLAVALAAPLGLACEDKKPTTDSAHADAGTGPDKYATGDPKLTRALQAAASASATSTSGPPLTGIFPPGAADARHKKGGVTTVEVIGDGSDPRVSLGGGADASTDTPRTSSYGLAVLEYAQQQGQRGGGAPTLDYQMVLGPAKKDEGGVDWLVASVKAVSGAREQMGQAPPGLANELASLAGSEIRVKLTADGREGDVLTTLGKAAHPELQRLVQNAAESLVFATVALPGKPVGVGAQSIAETRMPFGGLDVIAYRAFRVKSIEGDRLHLTIEVKAYAADKEASLPGVPKGATLEQFDDTSEGELELVRGETLARKFELQGRLVMVFSPPGGAPPPQPGQPAGAGMMTAQIASQATLVRGDDLRQAMKP